MVTSPAEAAEVQNNVAAMGYRCRESSVHHTRWVAYAAVHQPPLATGDLIWALVGTEWAKYVVQESIINSVAMRVTPLDSTKEVTVALNKTPYYAAAK